MLSLCTIEPNTLELLRKLSACPLLGSARLVGGTSLALQYGHRKSIDLDFVNYGCYDWIDDAVIEDGIVLASPKDIAAMKINAIIGRGTRKDFIDLYVLLKHYSICEIMSFYHQKYPDYSEYQALLSLTYFEDAESQQMPTMLIDDDWNSMKETILQAAEDYQA